jgi:general secretion pathway protein D
VIRLRDGETNLLAGLIRDDERQVLAGVPGLSDMPIVGRLFAHNKRETLETDIVMTLTPRIVRVLELTEADLRPFRVGRDGDGAGVLELPIPAVIPPAGGRPPVPPGGAPTPAPPPDAKPGTPAPVQPITPPPAR